MLVFIMSVFCRYDPNFIASSLDEAYLNVTEVCSERHLSGEEVSSFVIYWLIFSFSFFFFLAPFEVGAVEVFLC